MFFLFSLFIKSNFKFFLVYHKVNHFGQIRTLMAFKPKKSCHNILYFYQVHIRNIFLNMTFLEPYSIEGGAELTKP